MKKRLFALSVLVLLVGLPTTSDAQAPFEVQEAISEKVASEADGDRGAGAEEWWSWSSVCSGFRGAPFGLCIAYCEVLDCDALETFGHARACGRIGRRFARLTGSAPPCECPCVDGITDWLAALDGEFGYDSCVDSTSFGEFVVLYTKTGLAAAAQSLEALGQGFCGFGFGTGDFLTVTPEQGDVCNRLIRQRADAAGLVCSPSLP